VAKVEGFARAQAVGDDLQRHDAGSRSMPTPQCGFASHRKGTALTFAEQEAKLKLVVETATEVWGEA